MLVVERAWFGMEAASITGLRSQAAAVLGDQLHRMSLVAQAVAQSEQRGPATEPIMEALAGRKAQLVGEARVHMNPAIMGTVRRQSQEGPGWEAPMDRPQRCLGGKAAGPVTMGAVQAAMTARAIMAVAAGAHRGGTRTAPTTILATEVRSQDPEALSGIRATWIIRAGSGMGTYGVTRQPKAAML